MCQTFEVQFRFMRVRCEKTDNRAIGVEFKSFIFDHRVTFETNTTGTDMQILSNFNNTAGNATVFNSAPTTGKFDNINE